jgi:protein-tyrosine phosphatase
LIGCVLVFAALALPGPLHRYLFRGNLVEVIPGEVYRSAQPEVADLDRWAGELGLRSVVSLRRGGGSLLEDEREAASRLGLEHHLVGLSTGGMPPPGRLRDAVRVLDTAPRPLLLHCAAGVERSGLVAALARLLAGEDVDAARAELSLSRGYSPIVSRSDFHLVLDEYEAWLRETERNHEPAALREFVGHIYAPYYYRVEFDWIDPPESLRPGDAATLRIAVANRSRHPVPFRVPPEPGAVLAARVHALDPDDDFELELRGTALHLDLAPGDSAELELHIPALPEPGQYSVMIDLIDAQRLKWIGDLGSQRGTLQLHVEHAEGDSPSGILPRSN